MELFFNFSWIKDKGRYAISYTVIKPFRMVPCYDIRRWMNQRIKKGIINGIRLAR